MEFRDKGRPKIATGSERRMSNNKKKDKGGWGRLKHEWVELMERKVMDAIETQSDVFKRITDM